MWLRLCYFILACSFMLIAGRENGTSWQQCSHIDRDRKEIHILNCKHMDFKTVPKDLFKTPVRLIMLSGNPFKCNCDMKWFLRRLRRKNYKQKIIDLKSMNCANPARLKYKRIFRLKFTDICPKKEKAIDECALQLHKCHKFAQCSDRRIAYVCTCLPGFIGNGKFCADINECRLPKSPCHFSHAICKNSVGAYSCVCKKGFVKKKSKCEDIDECKLPKSPCHFTHANCRNSVGAYSCVCNKGFTMKRSKCEDIDECRTAPCGVNANCINTPGSYRCVCKNEYYGQKGKNCVKKDLAVKSCGDTPGPCDDVMEDCIDGERPGEFTCQCRAGFRNSNHGHCEDIDECETKTYRCDPIAECLNTAGSYTCVCPKTGYSNVGRECLDINECERNEHDCHPDAICENSPGSFSCKCRAGFKQFRKGRLCLKEDEGREKQKISLSQVIIGLFIVVLVAVLLAFYCFKRRLWKRKKTLENKPLLKEKPKRSWFSNFMFPEPDLNSRFIPANESALTLWSDSDEEN